MRLARSAPLLARRNSHDVGHYQRSAVIDAIIDRYLLAQQLVRSQHTIAWYEKRLRPLRALSKPLAAITLDDLRRTYGLLAKRTEKYQDHPSGRAVIHEPLSPATLRGYVRAWRAFFNWCADEILLAASPARKLQLPRIPKQPPKAISRSDLDRILEAAKLSSSRDYAIVLILADSACRVGALCAITLDNLDLDRRQAIVVSKGQTTFILFTARTADAIRAYLRDRPPSCERTLFLGEKDRPLQVGGVHALLDRLAEAAGVIGRHNPHSFRHGWAREALRQGADISDVGHVLGHSQIQTTFEFYGRWENDELHDIHDRFTQVNTVSNPAAEIAAHNSAI